MSVLIIGAKGQLGHELQVIGRQRRMDLEALDLPEFDLSDADQVAGVLRANHYSAVINAAAYTAVDKAEEDRQTAFAVNRDGPGLLASACQAATLPLLHVSTDYVFDGCKQGAYRETDPPAPIGVYGTSKLAGEEAIRNALPNHLIVRTAWLYGNHGQNFVKTMLGLFRNRDRISVVDDQVGCPTDARDLAEALWSMLDKIRAGAAIEWGTYHFCGGGSTSWYGFARAILNSARAYEEFKVTDIVPIPTKAYPTPAHRPANSVLDCTKIADAFGVVQRPWKESLEDMLGRLYK